MVENSLEKTGVPSIDELKKSPSFPSEEKIKEGPIAAIECFQEIVCDSCVIGCPSDCIQVDSSKAPPKIDWEKCSGCGLCIPSCPGLAIFVIDYNYSDEEALISFAYELYPLPKVGDTVYATNREGKKVVKARVERVLTNDKFDKTGIVSIAVPKRYYNEVRGMKE
jgi:ferredoxin